MSTVNLHDSPRTEPGEAVEVPPPAPPGDQVASPLDRPYRLTVEKYQALIDRGLLGKHDRVFLWKGRLVEKMTKGCPHVAAVNNLNYKVGRILPDGWFLQVEQPIALGNDGAPEPDLTVIRGTPNDYPTSHPAVPDIALVIEVSDTSLAQDLGDVLQTYAAEGIPVYWVANIPDRRIEVYTEPTGPVERPFYRAVQLYGPGDEVTVVIDGREVGKVAVKDALP